MAISLLSLVLLALISADVEPDQAIGDAQNFADGFGGHASQGFQIGRLSDFLGDFPNGPFVVGPLAGFIEESQILGCLSQQINDAYD